jgi:mannose/fructose/N-acetylgalactosamine-specific phosphotransferase system component IID
VPKRFAPGLSRPGQGALNTLRQTGSVVGMALFGSLVATSVIGGLAISIALLLTTEALAASMP